MRDRSRQARDPHGAPRSDPNVAGDDSELGCALRTMLEWRRAPTLAFHRHTGALVESNRGVVQSTATKDTHAPWVAPKGAAIDRSRTFDFGGLPLRLISEALDRDPSDWKIPSIVTDTMLRRIVEAHFAVWYVWHVPTGVCIVPGWPCSSIKRPAAA